ncbi:MAG TPA: hypothetical protein VGU73_10805 [Acidimicrobiia bacterium]|nr:hypothetical protein [Acidimicrobiia bacterium]
MSWLDLLDLDWGAETANRRDEVKRFERLRDGSHGEAVVLAREATGGQGTYGQEGNVSFCTYRLHVRYDDGSTAEITRDFFRPEACRAPVGAVVPVRYDPADKSEVEIDVPALEEREAAAKAEAIARGEAELARTAAGGRTAGQLEAVVIDRRLVYDGRTGGACGVKLTLRVRLEDGSTDDVGTGQLSIAYRGVKIGELIPARHGGIRGSKIKVDERALDERLERARAEKLDQAKAELARRASTLAEGRAEGLVLDWKPTFRSTVWDPQAVTSGRYDLLVGFPDGSRTEASVKAKGAENCRARAGDLLPLRYDTANPSRAIELDVDELRARQASRRADMVARAEPNLEPTRIPATWILGRGRVNDLAKEPSGDGVKCTITAAVRLADGSPLYFATFDVVLTPQTANRLNEGAVFTVRADPQDHSQLMGSWTEPIPNVQVNDPELIDPPARALREGRPCRLVVLDHARQNLIHPDGAERYAARVRVTADGSEFQAPLLVPPGEGLENGIELPAKRLADQPEVIAIDWDAARLEARPSPPGGPS